MHYEDYFMEEFYTVDVGAFFYELGHTPSVPFSKVFGVTWSPKLLFDHSFTLYYIVYLINL